VNSIIESAIGRTIAALDPGAMQGLAEHCPGLESFDFANYLRCSGVRMQAIINAIEEFWNGRPFSMMRILDYGSWLGNFSLMLKESGFDVNAYDRYYQYNPALSAHVALLVKNKITVYGCNRYAAPDLLAYDVVLSMSVIEHIHSTPRHYLQQASAFLKSGGLLILDTPNLAYLGNRRKLWRGESVFPAIAEQWKTAIPFEGHNREYTMTELKWMLAKIGHRVLDERFFNYSAYPWWKNPLAGLYWKLAPSTRELLFTVSEKLP
jgi:2-polyprenyl-3-methyl-5-hydroxy-6-metoxy-1,4-benzoquinol methylase